MRRSAVLFVVGAVLTGVPFIQGQEQASSGKKRLTYSVKHASAKTLAPVLAKHFQGAAEIQAVPDSAENVLLISAPAKVLDEITTLLGQLDRKPRQIDVELWIGEVFGEGPGPKAGDAAAAKAKQPEQSLDLREFTGPVPKVLAKLAALKASGHVGQWKHFKGIAQENQPFTVNASEMKSYVNNMTVTATGLVAKSLTRHQTGVRGEMTLTITPDKSILVDVAVGLTTPRNGKLLGIDNGVPVHQTNFTSLNFKSKVTVPNGQAVASQAVAESRAGDTSQTVLIISSRVLDGTGASR